jgi:RNase adapter protein RapZ
VTAPEPDGFSIDCDDERLQRRYIETCRPPPLAGDRPVMGGTRLLECRVVFPLRARADLVIDTSNLTATELKRPLTDSFGPRAQGVRVFITSFFKSLGIPRDARLIFKGEFLGTALALMADHIASSA